MFQLFLFSFLGFSEAEIIIVVYGSSEELETTINITFAFPFALIEKKKHTQQHLQKRRKYQEIMLVRREKYVKFVIFPSAIV